MSSKKRFYAKLYEKNMNTNSSFEKDTFNYFKSMYEQKLQDPDFNIYLEKHKLTQCCKSNGIDSLLVMIISGCLSIGIFILGTILGNPILLNSFLALFILIAGIFVTLITERESSKVNVWSTALIALDAAHEDEAVK